MISATVKSTAASRTPAVSRRAFVVGSAAASGLALGFHVPGLGSASAQKAGPAPAAVLNAIFAATGKMPRTLPLKHHKLV